MATQYSLYNPAGSQYTTKIALNQYFPNLEDFFNHEWKKNIVFDFLYANLLEKNGVLSGCVISQDGGNDAINTTGGFVWINGNKVTVGAAATFDASAEGWYISSVTAAGAVVHGYFENSTAQSAGTPVDAVIIGVTQVGNGVFTLKSFFNDVNEDSRAEEVDGATEHIQPNIAVGPTLVNTRVTDLETTFVASLSDGDKLLFLDSTILTANRTLTTEVEVWMDGPDDKVNLDTFDLTFLDVSGKITLTSVTGKLILNGLTHGLVIIGGVIVEQGPNFIGTYFTDEGLFSSGQIQVQEVPAIWGTQAQVTSLDANFYTTAAGDPLDKTASAFPLDDDDEILAIHNATLVANLKLQPVSSKRLKIGMAKGVTLNLGDAGSGVPFKFEVGSNIKKGSNIILRGDLEFDETTLSVAEKRIVNNRAYGVKIKYNKDDIFDPAFAGDMVFKDTEAFNPYLIPYLGEQFDWLNDASNTNKTLLRDLNRALQGLVFDGSSYVETRSRFSLTGIAAYRFQVNKGFGFLRQLAVDDPDIHSRTDINGVSVADTASFVNTSNVVTFVSITDIKNGMRISGADNEGIPDESSGTPGTTILKNVNTTAKTAEMFNALTGAVQNANSTVGSIAITLDNSGAAGGSKQIDAMQKTKGSVQGFSSTGTSDIGALSTTFLNSSGSNTGTTDRMRINFDNSLSTSPNAAKTNDDESRVKSILTNYYQRA